ncbi:uncharacterized protein I206_103325 [Kwoniella pini CBS 10737]|uniref:SET domain-containing protein n=1 Tax=Kwoniella pini CBS 10737 TaxID=1296096 RepID=A0A1B9IA84_9TREE|nr:uncharacterized protein I206_01669 [Kwoniella pini CBS 10737]OCF52380.1 hypothetical protein I206_01669 [Kwoniella pini CBS 10737]
MTSHGLLFNHPAPSREVLKIWLDGQGIIYNEDLEISEMEDGDGWRIIAKRDMDLGELICEIPKTSILSHRTSSCPTLPDLEIGTLGGQTILHLSLCLLHEFRLAEESPFYGYLQSLPRETISLPIFWDIPEIGGEDGKKAKKWLNGTEAERELTIRDKEGLSLSDIQNFYEKYSTLLPNTSNHNKPSSILSYYYCFSIISTRAFMIDLYHLIALCPFADILNHNSNYSNTSLSSDDFVCHLCGSLKTCKHDFKNSNGISFRLNHLNKKDISKIENDEKDTIELKVENIINIKKNKEVWNSYGDGINDGKLLVEWGFINQEFSGEGLIWNFHQELNFIYKNKIENENEIEIEEISKLIDKVAQNKNLSNFDHYEDENERLLCEQSKLDKRLLNLDHDGKISINIFGWLWFYSSSSSEYPMSKNLDYNEEENVKMLIKAVDLLERIWSVINHDHQVGVNINENNIQDDSKHPNQVNQLIRVVKQVIKMLRERLSKMYQPEMNQDDLFDLRDSLDPKDKNQYMAMTLSINERVLLRSTLNKWEDVLAYLE